MAPDGRPVDSERVVVIAPTVRDGVVTLQMLTKAGLDCTLADDTAALDRLFQEGLGALVVTDITLAGGGAGHLLSLIGQQPAWSNLPVLVLCRDGNETPALALALRTLHNVTVLDRPVSSKALVSAVQAGLRGRRWQYQIRNQIEELMQADAALRRADQRKDEFLATLAHELRNPLAPVKTGLAVLQRSPGDAAVFKSTCDMMGRQLTQLVRLIDELLDVSRISTGKLVLQRERLDLRTIVAAALESCQPVVDGARHRVTVLLPDHEAAVHGDATRLTQAVSNLVNNAAKYTPDGGHIELALSVHDEVAVITVSDNGLGIPSDMLERCFDMFAQVNRTLARAQGGLGIGLALVRKLVMLHGGQVSAASVGPDQGSRFTIELPLADGSVETIAPLVPEVDVPERLPKLRVMVVDDNADAAESLAAILLLDGHDTHVDYSAASALKNVGAFRPDAIFCDIGMPGMNGLEFAARLRSDSRFDRTLLVAVTGWGGEADVRRSQAAGFDRHLTKPVSLESLSALLANRVEHSG